jgi:hypothetical protein
MARIEKRKINRKPFPPLSGQFLSRGPAAFLPLPPSARPNWPGWPNRPPPIPPALGPSGGPAAPPSLPSRAPRAAVAPPPPLLLVGPTRQPLPQTPFLSPLIFSHDAHSFLPLRIPLPQLAPTSPVHVSVAPTVVSPRPPLLPPPSLPPFPCSRGIPVRWSPGPVSWRSAARPWRLGPPALSAPASPALGAPLPLRVRATRPRPCTRHGAAAWPARPRPSPGLTRGVARRRGLPTRGSARHCTRHGATACPARPRLGPGLARGVARRRGLPTRGSARPCVRHGAAAQLACPRLAASRAVPSRSRSAPMRALLAWNAALPDAACPRDSPTACSLLAAAPDVACWLSPARAASSRPRRGAAPSMARSLLASAARCGPGVARSWSLPDVARG